MDKELHRYAKELLDAGRVNEAWQVLLAITDYNLPPNTFFSRSVVRAAKLLPDIPFLLATRLNRASIAFWHT